MVVLKFQHTYKEILHNLEATVKFEFCSCVRLKSNTVRRQKGPVQVQLTMFTQPSFIFNKAYFSNHS